MSPACCTRKEFRSKTWDGRIIPCFRPDGVVNLNAPNWRANIDRLSQVSGVDVVDYVSFIQALDERREFFKAVGASAADHAALTPATAELTPVEADALFQ
jgi:glucuronate isomerase